MRRQVWRMDIASASSNCNAVRMHQVQAIHGLSSMCLESLDLYSAIKERAQTTDSGENCLVPRLHGVVVFTHLSMTEELQAATQYGGLVNTQCGFDRMVYMWII